MNNTSSNKLSRLRLTIKHRHSGMDVELNTRENSLYNFVLPIATVFLFFFINLPLYSEQPMHGNPHHTPDKAQICDNYIKIDGKTNVNHFHFVQKLNGQEGIVENSSKLQSQETLTLKIPADGFEPSNPMMYEDFLDFIKADEYPEIDITIFFNSTRLPAGNSNHISPSIKIGIAGQTNTYSIPGKMEECRDSSLHISGEVNIDLHDFNLKPPSKFMGMIKVKNKVFINFGLTLEN